MRRPAARFPALLPGADGVARRAAPDTARWRPWRRQAWGWAAALATGLALATPPAQPMAAPDGAAPADLAQQVLAIVNHYRASQGLSAWEPDAALTLIASAHSQRMALRQQIGHDGFDARFAQAHRRLCVENLAAGFDRAEPLLAAWQASPSHHANLLAPRPRRVGLGQVAGYITVLACD